MMETRCGILCSGCSFRDSLRAVLVDEPPPGGGRGAGPPPAGGIEGGLRRSQGGAVYLLRPGGGQPAGGGAGQAGVPFSSRSRMARMPISRSIAIACRPFL